jgi:hypothetical protein
MVADEPIEEEELAIELANVVPFLIRGIFIIKNWIHPSSSFPIGTIELSNSVCPSWSMQINWSKMIKINVFKLDTAKLKHKMLDQTEARHKRHKSIIKKRVRVWKTLVNPAKEEEEEYEEEEMEVEWRDPDEDVVEDLMIKANGWRGWGEMANIFLFGGIIWNGNFWLANECALLIKSQKWGIFIIEQPTNGGRKGRRNFWWP